MRFDRSPVVYERRALSTWFSSYGDAEIARTDITRPDNAAPDQTEVLPPQSTVEQRGSRAEYSPRRI